MKVRRYYLVISLGLGLAIATLWILGSQNLSAMAARSVGRVHLPDTPTTERHVCTHECAYETIQDAVDDAEGGDVIKVAAGTYTDIHARSGVTQVVYIDESVTIQGGYSPDDWITPDPEANPTTLDAQGQGRVLYIGYGKQVTVEGLHITGGNATVGGGPTNPYAPYPGGGVRSDGTLYLFNSWVFGNVADNGEGGGVAVRGDEKDIISGNLIYSNTATIGGGLMNQGSYAVIAGNQIISNTANSSHGGIGGGIMIGGSNIRLINNLIANNHITPGGQAGGSGIYLAGSSARIYHNSIINNQGAGDSGIGIGDYYGPTSSTVTLTNTLVVSQGVGLEISKSLPHTVTVNGVLWYATPVTVTHAPTENVTVKNQHTGDPSFAPDGYHLTTASAAIDRGVDSGINRDIDGDPRPDGQGYDLGADEYWWPKIYLPFVKK